MQISQRDSQHGFTIVELLIVIVVIGVLAAITIVAFNGVQQRARDAKRISAIDTFEKAVRLYKTSYGEYPSPSTNERPACIGELADYPSVDGFSAGRCMKDGDTRGAYVDEDFNAKLREIIPAIPNASYPVAYDAFRGAWYSTSGDDAYIHYYDTASGGKSCGRGVIAVQPENEAMPEGMTVCSIVLE